MRNEFAALLVFVAALSCSERVVTLAESMDSDTARDSPIDSETGILSSDTEDDTADSEWDGAVNSIFGVITDLVGAPYNPDMGEPWGAHEALPLGVPSSFDWYKGVRPGAWTDSGGTFQCPAFFGMVLEALPGNEAMDIRIQVRNQEQWFLLNGVWQLFDAASETIAGGNIRQDYSSNEQVSDLQMESEANGGGISFNMVKDYGFQWWSPQFPRPVRPADGVDAWFVTVQVRWTAVDERSVNPEDVHYIVRTGMTWYRFPEHVSEFDGTIADAAIPRFRKVTREWRHLNLLLVGDAVPTNEQSYVDMVLSLPPLPGVSY